MLFLEVGLLVVGVTVAVMLHIPSEAYMMYSWIGIPIFTLMIFSFCGLKFEKLKDSKVLKYASEVSYVFFFAQFFTWPITRLIFQPFGGVENVGFIKTPVSLLICIVITVLMHELIEKPITKILKRILL